MTTFNEDYTRTTTAHPAHITRATRTAVHPTENTPKFKGRYFIVSNLSGRPEAALALAHHIKSDSFPENVDIIINGNLVAPYYHTLEQHDEALAALLQPLESAIHQKSSRLTLIPGTNEAAIEALTNHRPSGDFLRHPPHHYLQLASSGFFLQHSTSFVKDYLILKKHLLLVGTGYLDQVNPLPPDLPSYAGPHYHVVTPFPPYQLLDGQRIGGYTAEPHPYLGTLERWQSLPFHTYVDDDLIFRTISVSRLVHSLGQLDTSLTFAHFAPTLKEISHVPHLMRFDTAIPYYRTQLAVHCTWVRSGITYALFLAY